MEEVLRLVRESEGRSSANHGGQGHGVRGNLGQGGVEGRDGEVPPGLHEDGSDQGRHGRTGLGYHGQTDPAEEGPGTDGGRGQERRPEERAREVAPHEGHAGRLDDKGRERKDVVGCGLHVLFRLPEGRRGSGSRRSGVRREGPPVVGGRAVGGRPKPQMDPSSDKRVHNRQDESGGLRDPAQDRSRRLPSESCVGFHGMQSVGAGPVLHWARRSGSHQAGLRGGSQKGPGGERDTGGRNLRPQFPYWGSHGSGRWRCLGGGSKSPGEMEEQGVQGLY